MGMLLYHGIAFKYIGIQHVQWLCTMVRPFPPPQKKNK